MVRRGELPEFVYHQIGGSSQSGSAGEQQIFVLSMGTKSDLTNMHGQILQQQPTLNPNTVGLNSDKFFVKALKQEIVMKNDTTEAVWLTFYHTVYRKDLQSTGGVNWSSPVTAWANGLSDVLAGASSAPGGADAVIGATPFMSPLFTSMYKVLKVRKLCLAPGGILRIEHINHVNKVIDYAQFSTSLGNLTIDRHMWSGLMVVAWGMPIPDASAGVTTCKTSLIWTSRTKWLFSPCPLPSNPDIYLDQNTSTTQTTGSTVTTNVSLISPTLGTPVPFQQFP